MGTPRAEGGPVVVGKGRSEKGDREQGRQALPLPTQPASVLPRSAKGSNRRGMRHLCALSLEGLFKVCVVVLYFST